MSQRYPLSWPEGWKRTPPSERVNAKFVSTTLDANNFRRVIRGISIANGVQRVLDELRRIGTGYDDASISTNIEPRLDGMPRSDRREPSDPGAAVYWKRNGRQECMAIDRYTRVADNLAAIAATLEAMRAIERHGGAQIIERAFRGFAALPQNAGGRGWREILIFGERYMPSVDEVKSAFRVLAQKYHNNGICMDRDKYEELVWARDQALREIGANGESAKA
jgi:hypothetical protein